MVSLGHTVVQKDTCTPVFIAALFAIARTWKPSKCPSTEEWIKKYVVHIDNGTLVSHKKERNWIICGDVHEPRVCHTE